MTISVEYHFSLNKILLLIVGLWPYHRTKLVEFHHIIFTAILSSFVIVQVCLYFFNRIIIYLILQLVHRFPILFTLIISYHFLNNIVYNNNFIDHMIKHDRVRSSRAFHNVNNYLCYIIYILFIIQK